jgi:phosphoserine phosphatase RsbU/P
MPQPQPQPFAPRSEKDLSYSLTEALVQGSGMNDFLYRFLQAIGNCLSVTGLVLYDFDEATETFDLLFFCGYPADSRSNLRRRLHTIDLRRAMGQRDPYWLDESRLQLIIPLYFQDTLEAILLLEQADHPLELDETRLAACRVVSRFLGLFMSSNRLPVNRKSTPITSTELERARQVQLSYLPARCPVSDRYEIYGYNQSSALVGGDYFDYFCQRENSIQCVVADACGHGMAAALVMSAFRGMLHTEVARADEFSTLFTRLNLQLYSGGGLLRYLTAVFFDYSEERGELRYLNAGHFDPLLIHADGSSGWLEGGGPPLGMFQTSCYSINRAPAKPGDLLVLFTDGLVDLRNATEEFFGLDGILEAVLDCRHLPLSDLAKDVLACAGRFSHNPQPEDDLTLFLMRFR